MTLMMAMATKTRARPSPAIAARCFRTEPSARRTFRALSTAQTIASSPGTQSVGGEPSVPHGLQSRREAIRNAKPFSEFLTDSFNRQHDYLRISVTERCNLRCLYCMPEEGVPLSPPAHLLTTPEIFYLSSLFVSQGVTKIRLTGGEPTVRRDIVPLMQRIGSLRSNGLRELALTTNGISLHRKLDAMVEAGLTGVNLSLDTLDPFQFQIMTRRNGFSAVMKSIDRILEMNKLGANVKLKVNCVVMRGMNERDIIPFVEMGREKDIEVRFIEYMPFGGNKWSQAKMISFQEMLDLIRTKYPDLRSVPGHRNDTSKTFAVPGFIGKVGFITSMTNDFCGTCNRLRITSDGSLKVCLHGNAEVSLRDLLRQDNQGEPIDEEAFERIKKIEMDRRDGLLRDEANLPWGNREQELLQVIGAAVKRKAEKHADMGDLEKMENRPMILIDQPRKLQPAYSQPAITHIKFSYGPWLNQSWSPRSLLHSSPTVLAIGATIASPSPSSIRAFSGTVICEDRKKYVQNWKTKHEKQLRGTPRFAKEKKTERSKPLAAHPEEKPPLDDEQVLEYLGNIEKGQRLQEEKMIHLLSVENDQFVRKYDFDRAYRKYWRSIMYLHIREARYEMNKIHRRLGIQHWSSALLDVDIARVPKMGTTQRAAVKSGLRYNYGFGVPLRCYDENIVTIHNEKGTLFVPTHAIRTKIAELEARITLEKTYPRQHSEMPNEWYRLGPWIEYMEPEEQRLRYNIQHRHMPDGDQISQQWKANFEQMETNLLSFKRHLQRRLGIIEVTDTQEEAELHQDLIQQEIAQEDDNITSTRVAKLDLTDVGQLKARRNALIEKRAAKLAQLSRMRNLLTGKTHESHGVRLENLSDTIENSAIGVAANTTQVYEEPTSHLATVRTRVAEPTRTKEIVLQELKTRQASLAQAREAKLKQLQSYKIPGDRKRLELSLDCLLSNTSKTTASEEDATDDKHAPISHETQSHPDMGVSWPRPVPLSPAFTPKDSLKGYIPPSGFVEIDDNLTININAPAEELQSQITALIDRLKTKYPRLAKLPYDVTASSNPATLQTWLKILVKKWQTRFDSWIQYNKNQSSAGSNAYYGNVHVDANVKAVLDQMVEDHELSGEGAQRMAARWLEVFDRKSKLAPTQDPDSKLDWEEWDSSGMSWLGNDQASGSMYSGSAFRGVNSNAWRTVSSATPSPPLEQIRHYSSSRNPSASSLTNSTAKSNNPTMHSTTVEATPSLPHLTLEGSAHMVSVSKKKHTLRTAIATGTVHFSNPTPLQLIRSNSIKKGDVLSVSRIAGIMAAKKCPDLVPLCHPILLSHVGVELLPFGGEILDNSEAPDACGGVMIEAKVQCEGQTGVEMEALSSVMGAALTVVDMCKAVDKGMRINDVHVVLKEGGRSETWKDEGWESIMKGVAS